MKKRAVLVGLVLGISLVAKADLLDPVLLTDAGPQSTEAIEQTVSDELGFDVVALLRYEPNVDLAGPPFTIEYSQRPRARTAEVSWDLEGDEELFAIYVFAGGQAHLYLVTDDQRTFSLAETVEAPLNVGGRQPAIARIVFLGLGERRQIPAEIPDGGATLALFGLSLAGLAFIRRRIMRK